MSSLKKNTVYIFYGMMVQSSNVGYARARTRLSVLARSRLGALLQ